MFETGTVLIGIALISIPSFLYKYRKEGGAVLGIPSSFHYGQFALFASTGSREDLQEKEKVSLQTGKKPGQMIWLFSFLVLFYPTML
jgi:hypothetical protein